MKIKHLLLIVKILNNLTNIKIQIKNKIRMFLLSITLFVQKCLLGLGSYINFAMGFGGL